MNRSLNLLRSVWAQIGLQATRRRTFFADLVRFPLRREAALLVEGTPAVSLDELAFSARVEQITLLAGGRDRHSWGLPILESEALGVLLHSVAAQRVFEIGTFDGGTTAFLAQRAGADSQVFTLDLPDDEFDQSQFPPNFNSSMIGHLHRTSEVADRIVQLRGNSHRFDYSPWAGSIDLVFVDAGHDWPSGVADTRAARKLVRPGGLIVWDDFDPHWSGLVRGIVVEAGDLQLTRVRGTRLVFARIPT